MRLQKITISDQLNVQLQTEVIGLHNTLEKNQLYSSLEPFLKSVLNKSDISNFIYVHNFK